MKAIFSSIHFACLKVQQRFTVLKELTKPSPPLSYFNILWCRWRTCWESKCLTRGELFACSWKSTQKNTAGIALSLIVNVTLASISNISALIHPASYKTHDTVMVLKIMYHEEKSICGPGNVCHICCLNPECFFLL